MYPRASCLLIQRLGSYILSRTASQRMEYSNVYWRQYYSLYSVSFTFRSISVCSHFLSSQMLLRFYWPFQTVWYKRNYGRVQGQGRGMNSLHYGSAGRGHSIPETWEVFAVHVS